MSENRLFEDFKPVTDKAWKQKIQVDLKGADYNDTLVWKSPEGIMVKPFYTAEDLETTSTDISDQSVCWGIGQMICAENVATAKEKCKEALVQGVDSLVIKFRSDEISAKQLFSNIDLKGKTVYLDVNALSPDTLAKWLNEVPLEKDQVIVLYDIIGHLAATGNWHSNKDEDFRMLGKLNSGPDSLDTISIDMSRYQNAGANRIQQLAYSLAHAWEYFNHIQSFRASKMIFNVSVDTNYFFEIAKLKALRLLWQKLAEHKNLKTSCHILAFPTLRNKTLYDYNVNMLRTTTECMAAILGGADTVYNLPYDLIYHAENEFAERIARNQLLILKNESYFDKNSNAASGAYYIDKLIAEMVQKSWALFLQIDSGGGFLDQLNEHKIQNKIKESARKQQESFDMGDEVLVGSNKYPNEKDFMKTQLQKDPFLKKEKKKTLIEPILEKRLAESLEKNRLDHE